MSEEEQNRKLHLQEGLRRNILSPREAVELRGIMAEEKRQAEQAQKAQSIIQTTGKRSGFVMGEGELQKGGENRNHFTNAVG